jgi:hypothetical protein
MRLLDRPSPWGMRYSIREVIDRAWRLHIVWWIIRLIPRQVKYYVVVQGAVKDNDGNPGARTAEEMLRVFERAPDA